MHIACISCGHGIKTRTRICNIMPLRSNKGGTFSGINGTQTTIDERNRTKSQTNNNNTRLVASRYATRTQRDFGTQVKGNASKDKPQRVKKHCKEILSMQNITETERTDCTSDPCTGVKVLCDKFQSNLFVCKHLPTKLT